MTNYDMVTFSDEFKNGEHLAFHKSSSWEVIFSWLPKVLKNTLLFALMSTALLSVGLGESTEKRNVI